MNWTAIGWDGRGKGYTRDRGGAGLLGVGIWLIYTEIVDLYNSDMKGISMK